MNAKELVDAVAAKADLPKGQVKRMLDACAEVKAEALRRGESISIPGEGILKVKERGPRMGRNIHTGEKVQVAAKTVVKFVPAKSLAETVNRA
jgi:DNA-binding protein HU-beta